MKIQILGVARTGTTNLALSIEKEGYTTILEPYGVNPKKNKTELVEKLCVKNISNQFPIDKFKSAYDFQLENIPTFDKTILLDRKNELEHWKSYLNLLKKYHKDPKTTHTIWYEDDITSDWDRKMRNDGFYEVFKLQKETIKKLSNEFNIPITYYEDLFGEDRMYSFETINKWDLDIDPFNVNEYLDPSKRYKQTGKRSQFI
jgi:hypothetical protein|tara:strand:- start:108 stop:713 length:606 start_codon:yes stop_codon:yes gene_type:complete